ncbi:hypothetical protein Pyrde_0392 [Pyrodictium delaneyi]|uniref:Membrane-bound metal-dependent hydrolase n=1 Tax=Pyrodictium delaneyi TaxID=1273541 RepID=A0A0P0N1L7_9CREN|nr:metal-dependent hydrolase [Pyrodictium delaneyi]ALL00442.1 hypothetical protein Pyrde_0392 [Pyrodictium delaneyi]
MNRSTHVAFTIGFTTAMLWGLRANVSSLLVVVPIAVAATLIPDMDLRKAHRLLLHNISAAAMFTILVYLAASKNLPNWLAELAALGFLLGYVSHLLLDMFTIRGVALLYPLSRRFYRLARLRSNDPRANTVLKMASALLTAYSVAAMSGIIRVGSLP